MLRPTLTALLLAAVTFPTAQAQAKPRPDLVTKAVVDPSATAAPGSTIALGATVRNRGKRTAKRSSLGFLLSVDGRRSEGDVIVTLARTPKLKRGKRRTIATAGTVPPLAPGSTWRVLACADEGGAVKERKERNNCRASAGTLTVQGGPDPSPGPAEVCNGGDDDGDGAIDEGVCAVTVSVNGPGKVNSDSAGIACPPDCSGTVPFGFTAELVAVPDPGGRYLTGWSGSCTGTESCTVGPETTVGAAFATASVPAAEQIVINEVHAVPQLKDVDGNGSVSAQSDEFVEIVNVSGSVLALGGVEVRDPVGGYTFGDEVLHAGCAVAVFGAGAQPTGGFGGARVVVGGPSLHDSSDTVTVQRGAVTIQTMTYPSTSTDASWSRWPELTGPWAGHPSLGGKDFSPGARSNGAPWC